MPDTAPHWRLDDGSALHGVGVHHAQSQSVVSLSRPLFSFQTSMPPILRGFRVAVPICVSAAVSFLSLRCRLLDGSHYTRYPVR